MKKQIKGHQGDVQFFSIKEIPDNAKKVDNKPIVYGEHSGNCHVVTGDVEMFEVEGRIIVAVGSGGARLQHIYESKLTTEAFNRIDEIEIAGHKSHLLEKGIYEFYIQNSYNPYSKLMEKVTD